jgi:hypothetical protein
VFTLHQDELAMASTVIRINERGCEAFVTVGVCFKASGSFLKRAVETGANNVRLCGGVS